eukprot:TRINITY_DN2658_c0_g2_i1.p1 TRINITY_DN2658_c0_g2~~TRINITY_DN2658_c0_g2_i1.p1  ORF type:complete len:724 (+),score=158.21 TRINITY_DN2658_c0_g2_i1:38-2173(+)
MAQSMSEGVVAIVSGGTGFIGSKLCQALLANHNVERIIILTRQQQPEQTGNKPEELRIEYITCNILDLEPNFTLPESLQGVKATYFFHLSADINWSCAFTPEAGAHHKSTISSLFRFLDLLLPSLRAVAFASSLMVYPLYRENRPLFEETIDELPCNFYGGLKLSIEDSLRAWVHQLKPTNKVKVWSFRIGNTYGVNMRVNKMLTEMIDNALRDLPIKIFGSGDTTLDWVHVDDIVQALCIAIRDCGNANNDNDNSSSSSSSQWDNIESSIFAAGGGIALLNAGTGVGVSYLQLAHLIVSLVNSKSEIQLVPERIVAHRRQVMNISQLQSLIPKYPTVSLRSGLLELIQTSEFFSTSPRKILKPFNTAALRAYPLLLEGHTTAIIGAGGNMAQAFLKHLAISSEPKLVDTHFVLIDLNCVVVSSSSLPTNGLKATWVSIEDNAKLSEALSSVEIVIDFAGCIFSNPALDATQRVLFYSQDAISHLHSILNLVPRLKAWLYVSSISVYSEAALAPFRENITPLVPQTPYGMAKLAAERYLRIASVRQGFHLIVVRLPDIYGGSRPVSKLDVRMLPQLIRQASPFFNSNVPGKFTVFGDGSALRDLLGIDEAVGAIREVFDACGAEDHQPDEPNSFVTTVNIGSGGIPIKEIINAVQKVFSGGLPDSNITYLSDKQLQSRYLSTEKFASIVGRKASIDLERLVRQLEAQLIQQ